MKNTRLAKKYLSQIGLMKVRIEQRQREANEIRELAMSTGAIDYSKEKVDGGKHSNIQEDMIVKYSDMLDEIDGKIHDMKNLQHKIIGEIQVLENKKYVRILDLIYVQHKNLRQISEVIGYSVSGVKKLHGRALMSFFSRYELVINNYFSKTGTFF